MKKFVKIFLLATIVYCMPLLSEARSPEDPGDDPDYTGAPFDGGLSLIIAAGAGYAIKKARDKRKQSEINDEVEK